MTRMLTLMLLLAHTSLTVTSDECNCKMTSCGTPVNCTQGLVWDHCYCCKVCAKDEGEVCGGKNYIYGECAKRLECVVRHPDRYLNRFHQSNDRVIGRCEPYSCIYRRCPFGQRCFIKDRLTHCDCNISCSGMIREPVCGETNMKYYDNECELRNEECRLGTRIGISILPCSGPNITSISCSSSQMQLNIRRTFLGRSVPRRLVLNDPQCKASINRTHITASTFLNSCGTKILYTLHSIIYSNTLRTLPPRNALISRGKAVNITFKCEFALKKRTRNPVKITQIRPSLQNGRTTRSLKNGMLVEIDTKRNYTVVLRTLKYRGLNIKLMPRDCYVASVQHGMKDAKCPIISKGCPMEVNVRVKSVSNSRIVLQIPGFRFKNVRKRGIHVRCKTRLCFPSSLLDFANCSVNCERKSKRRRRSLITAAEEGSDFQFYNVIS